MMDEEFSLSKELLPEELTSQYDVGNEQNWLKSRKSKDPYSFLDLNEFLNAPIQSENTKSTCNNSTPSRCPREEQRSLEPRKLLETPTSRVACDQIANDGDPGSSTVETVHEYSLLENVSPPSAYEICDITLSETPSFRPVGTRNFKHRKLIGTHLNYNASGQLSNDEVSEVATYVNRPTSQNTGDRTISGNPFLNNSGSDEGSVCVNETITVSKDAEPQEYSNPGGLQGGDEDMKEPVILKRNSIIISEISPILKPNLPPDSNLQRRGTIVIEHPRFLQSLGPQADKKASTHQLVSTESKKPPASKIRKPSLRASSSILSELPPNRQKPPPTRVSTMSNLKGRSSNRRDIPSSIQQPHLPPSKLPVSRVKVPTRKSVAPKILSHKGSAIASRASTK